MTAFFCAWLVASVEREVSPAAGAILTVLACGAVGGTLALVLAPPLRAATAFAVILAVRIASIAVARPLEAVSGPGGVARALANRPNDHDGNPPATSSRG